MAWMRAKPTGHFRYVHAFLFDAILCSWQLAHYRPYDKLIHHRHTETTRLPLSTMGQQQSPATNQSPLSFSLWSFLSATTVLVVVTVAVCKQQKKCHQNQTPYQYWYWGTSRDTNSNHTHPHHKTRTALLSHHHTAAASAHQLWFRILYIAKLFVVTNVTATNKHKAPPQNRVLALDQEFVNCFLFNLYLIQNMKTIIIMRKLNRLCELGGRGEMKWRQINMITNRTGMMIEEKTSKASIAANSARVEWACGINNIDKPLWAANAFHGWMGSTI